MYLEDEIDKLFEIYPKPFTSQIEILFRKLAENQYTIDYQKCPYKILFSDGEFHEYQFFKKIWYFIWLVGKSSN